MSTSASITYRYRVAPADRQRVREIVQSTGFFSTDEIDVAVELVDECLTNGPAASGYWFVFAEQDGKTLGYACYGPIAATACSYDLFWIAVDDACRGQGLGRKLMNESERLILASGGHRVYVETSSRPQYLPTRAFYERCGYQQDAFLEEFYAPGDGKIILVKAIY